MLHMQQQGNVQHVGFKLGVFLVRAQHLQQIFGGRKLRLGAMDVHAAAALIIMVGVVAVDGQHWEHADQLDALFQLGLQVGLADVVIVAGKGQHTAGQRVHQIAAGGFHDHIAHKVGGQIAAFDQAVLERFELRFVGQVANEQKIRGFLKGIAFAAQAADQVIHIIAAIPEFAIARHFFSVAFFKGINAGDVGNACQHTLAILVAQAALDVVLPKEGRVDAVVGDTFLRKNGGFFFNGCVIAHG